MIPYPGNADAAAANPEKTKLVFKGDLIKLLEEVTRAAEQMARLEQPRRSPWWWMRRAHEDTFRDLFQLNRRYLIHTVERARAQLNAYEGTQKTLYSASKQQRGPAPSSSGPAGTQSLQPPVPTSPRPSLLGRRPSLNLR